MAGFAGKIVGSLVGLMLVVGVVIGVVSMMGDKGGGGSTDNETVSTSTKATVDAMCAPTTHKQACESSLKPVASNPNATIQDYLGAALRATLDQVKKAVETTEKVSVNKDDDPHNDQMGVDDCKEFLGYAIDQLEASMSSVGDSELHTLQDRVQELVGWLTGVYVYQQTCVDQLEKPEYKSPIQNGMLDATQLTDNAIYIFSEITNILGTMNLTGGLFPGVGGGSGSAASRRLLEDDDLDEEGNPPWISEGDRMLMEGGGQHSGGHHGGGGGHHHTSSSGGSGGGGGSSIKADAVVAQDGSGQFKTINDAVNSVPKKNTKRFVIHVKAGTYKEVVQIKKKANVFIYGDGIGKTIVTNDLNVALKKVKTSNSATIGVDSDGFMIRSMTIQNTAGPAGHQAVALRIAGENAVVSDCSIEGYQDTLYYHRGRQFYKNCVISGTVDFLFGNGRAIIQDSTIIVRKPGPGQNNMVTADGGLTPRGQHGLVLQNCKIIAEKGLESETKVKTYLGRPWKAYALTLFMQSDIGGFVAPEGYSIFTNVGEGSKNQETAIYGEYQNTGAGAQTTKRDKATFKKWHLLSPQEAQGYTVGSFIQGAAWLKDKNVPYKLGL